MSAGHQGGQRRVLLDGGDAAADEVDAPPGGGAPPLPLPPAPHPARTAAASAAVTENERERADTADLLERGDGRGCILPLRRVAPGHRCVTIIVSGYSGYGGRRPDHTTRRVLRWRCSRSSPCSRPPRRAARRYAKKNPEQAAKFVDQAAQFVDKQTKGKYSGQITGAAQKAKSVAGIERPGGGPAANGQAPT